MNPWAMRVKHKNGYWVEAGLSRQCPGWIHVRGGSVSGESRNGGFMDLQMARRLRRALSQMIRELESQQGASK